MCYNGDVTCSTGRQNKIKKKIKKLGKKGYFLIPMLAFGSFVFPLMFKGLAALTLKALLAAKVAFLLAGLLLISSFGQKTNSHRSYAIQESHALDPWGSDRNSQMYQGADDGADKNAYNDQFQHPYY